MTTTAPQLRTRPRATLAALLLLSAALVAAATVDLPGGEATAATPAVAPSVTQPRPLRALAGRREVAPPQVRTFTYVAHNGARREATLLLPASYTPTDNPPLPLVISPHGRGGSGHSNATFWGRLPSRGNFAVVNPDGMGRRLEGFSYGYAGQIDDLARMPQLVVEALPWVRIDPERIFALGSSMGGQETLLLVARHPHLLAGAAALDSVTDLARRFDQVLELPTHPNYVERWGTTQGASLQSAMRREVGGTPEETPAGYAARSPLRQARAIAASGVPLQLWWSEDDEIVFDQEHQSEALFRELGRIGTRAPVVAYAGHWAHSKEMRATALLSLALREFQLLPPQYKRVPDSVERLSLEAAV
jgi:dipeptidyl aminopeptidase/acylaminoacyl peptidase